MPKESPPVANRALLAMVVLAALAIIAFTAPTFHPYDFCSYYSTGLLTNEGDARAAFDFDRINERHSRIHPDLRPHRVGSFYYSPLFLGPAAALASLEFETARTVNQIAILLALGGILYLVLEKRRPWWLMALLLAAFVAGNPVQIQFVYQNWTAILVLLVALALRQTVKGKDRSAVLFWALAFHLKLYVGLFLLPLWLIGKKRLALGAVAVFLVLLALPLPWTGFDTHTAFAKSMVEEASGGVTVFFNQISIPAALARTARPVADWRHSNDPVSHPALSAVVWIGLLAYGFLTWRLRHKPRHALALTIPFLLLFLPKMWDHGELLFFPLFMLAVLPLSLEVFAAGYLLLSFALGPLVQLLLPQAIQGEITPLQVHVLLLFYPLLNLLAAAALWRPQPDQSGDKSGELAPPRTLP